MSNTITANDLKTRGVSAINEATSNGSEVIITLRGKSKYVVLPIDKYNQLREYELEAAILESKRDVKNGKFIEESVEDHIKRITSA